jgi:hypothetical protein
MSRRLGRCPLRPLPDLAFEQSITFSKQAPFASAVIPYHGNSASGHSDLQSALSSQILAFRGSRRKGVSATLSHAILPPISIPPHGRAGSNRRTRQRPSVRPTACTELQHGCSSYRSPRTEEFDAVRDARQAAGCVWRQRCHSDSLPAAGPPRDKVMRFRSPAPGRRQSEPRCRSSTIAVRRHHGRALRYRRTLSLAPARSSLKVHHGNGICAPSAFTG